MSKRPTLLLPRKFMALNCKLALNSLETSSVVYYNSFVYFNGILMQMLLLCFNIWHNLAKHAIQL